MLSFRGSQLSSRVWDADDEMRLLLLRQVNVCPRDVLPVTRHRDLIASAEAAPTESASPIRRALAIASPGCQQVAQREIRRLGPRVRIKQAAVLNERVSVHHAPRPNDALHQW